MAIIHLISATPKDEKPLKDARLEQLKSISLPRIFTSDEMSTIDSQMDVLKLGIDLFLAQNTMITPEEQQAIFNDAWPLLSCLFKADWEPSDNKLSEKVN